MLKKIMTPINFLMVKGLDGKPGNFWDYVCQYLIACGIGANLVMIFLFIKSLT
jgi:hypothetical protein